MPVVPVSKCCTVYNLRFLLQHLAWVVELAFGFVFTLHSMIAHALFGMNLDRPPKLSEAFQRTLTRPWLSWATFPVAGHCQMMS